MLIACRRHIAYPLPLFILHSDLYTSEIMTINNPHGKPRPLCKDVPNTWWTGKYFFAYRCLK